MDQSLSIATEVMKRVMQIRAKKTKFDQVTQKHAKKIAKTYIIHMTLSRRLYTIFLSNKK